MHPGGLQDAEPNPAELPRGRFDTRSRMFRPINLPLFAFFVQSQRFDLIGHTTLEAHNA